MHWATHCIAQPRPGSSLLRSAPQCYARILGEADARRAADSHRAEQRRKGARMPVAERRAYLGAGGRDPDAIRRSYERGPDLRDGGGGDWGRAEPRFARSERPGTTPGGPGATRHPQKAQVEQRAQRPGAAMFPYLDAPQTGAGAPPPGAAATAPPALRFALAPQAPVWARTSESLHRAYTTGWQSTSPSPVWTL